MWKLYSNSSKKQTNDLGLRVQFFLVYPNANTQKQKTSDNKKEKSLI